jgi:hypothetical protein
MDCWNVLLAARVFGAIVICDLDSAFAWRNPFTD